ncbi:hypothetical protein FSP39_014104 [Pinctada imbricata]|uniref:1-phosphatidylinositol-5-phosphate 4-kinase n=1 Tax=Pinctada imbricata TaxID=66713 RepID=A0AA88YX10_PINIB|nr:hypothetical protein FSP39_014104 [Pinctada imbricata]
MLMPEDFKAFSKVRVDNHLFNKESMPSHFKVKEYCPIVFRNLRDRFNIDDMDYMNSFSKPPFDIDSPGRSGARMLMSHDKKFFIKTLVSEEVEQMHHILKQYHQYIVEVHGQTLLPQYLGMYRITVNDTETYLIAMRNVFSPRLTIHKKYDLKGSTVDRQASDKEKSKELPTYKDNDFVNDRASIYIGKESKEKLLKQLTKDAEVNVVIYYIFLFFSRFTPDGLQPYCWYPLTVIERTPILFDSAMNPPLEEEEEEEVSENGLEEELGEDQGGMGCVPTPPESPQPAPYPPFTGDLDTDMERFAIRCSSECPRREIYFMAMIDILTKYGVKKRTAQAAKTMKHGAGAEFSTIKPDQYAKRFLDFLDKNIQ